MADAKHLLSGKVRVMTNYSFNFCLFPFAELHKILLFLDFPVNEERFACTFDQPDGSYRRPPIPDKLKVPFDKYQVTLEVLCM